MNSLSEMPIVMTDAITGTQPVCIGNDLPSISIYFETDDTLIQLKTTHHWDTTGSRWGAVGVGVSATGIITHSNTGE